MADVNLEIGGDSSGGQKAIKDLARENEKLRQKLIEVEQASKKAGQATEKSFSGSNLSLGQTVATLGKVSFGVLSVATATNAVLNLNAKWRQDLEELKQKYAEIDKSIVKTTALAGDARQGATIDARLNSLKGATRAQGAAAFAGVTQGAPGLTLERRLDLAEQAAQLAPTGMDVGATGNIMAKVGEVFSGRSADDIKDLVVGAQQRLGEDVTKLSGDKFYATMAKLRDEGMSPQKAFAAATGAVENNLPVAEALDAYSKSRPSSPAEAQTRAQLKRIIGDNAERETFYGNAMQNNIGTTVVTDLKNFAAGQTSLSSQNTALVQQQFDLTQARELDQAQRAKDRVMSLSEQRTPKGEYSWMQRTAQGMLLDTYSTVAGMFGQDRSDAILSAGKRSFQGRFTAQDAAQFNAEEAKIQREYIDATKKLTKAIERQHIMPRTKNIDAHTE